MNYISIKLEKNIKTQTLDLPSHFKKLKTLTKKCNSGTKEIGHQSKKANDPLEMGNKWGELYSYSALYCMENFFFFFENRFVVPQKT